MKSLKSLKRLSESKITGVSKECDEWLESIGYYEKPASIKYHSNCTHGLYYHSKEVTNQLLKLTVRMGLQWERKESIYIIGFLHDVCKCDDYILDPVTGEYAYNDLKEPGHGDKSVRMLLPHIDLTEEEEFCIRYHMGAFTEKEEWKNYNNAIAKYPNVLWVHTADMIASQIKEV